MASSTGVCDAMVENGLAALARPKAARRNMGRSVRTGGRRRDPRQRKVNKVRGLVVCRQSATADANQSPAAATVTLNVSAGPQPVGCPMRQSPGAPIPVKPAAREVGRKRHLQRSFPTLATETSIKIPAPESARPIRRSALPKHGMAEGLCAAPSRPPRDPQPNMENPICSLGVFRTKK